MPLEAEKTYKHSNTVHKRQQQKKDKFKRKKLSTKCTLSPCEFLFILTN